MNRAELLGRLTRDPELRFAAGSGTAVSRFTLAVNRRKKQDEEKAQADFSSCVALGKTAETISQYFTKGKQIAVSGSIRTGSYDAQDGTKKYTTDVAIDTFDFIGNSNVSNSTDEKGLKDSLGDIMSVEDDDMPF